MRIQPLLLLALALAPLSAACGGADPSQSDATADELRKGTNDRWVYNGLMPHLESASITVSLQAHTARVTGLAPAGFTGPLPYYADAMMVDGRMKLTVVYPIATGAQVNSQGTSYSLSSVSPWVPSDSKATWGGFPFMPYNHGIAFHGPITAADGQWHLTRGPVSHGCNRMVGEHVVELAHLIGVNMSTKVQSGSTVAVPKVPVTVLHNAPDTYNGKLVDVDYPALASVKRPKGSSVRMWKTWTADTLPTFVCSLAKADITASRTIPEGYCGTRFTDTIDAETGAPITAAQ